MYVMTSWARVLRGKGGGGGKQARSSHPLSGCFHGIMIKIIIMPVPVLLLQNEIHCILY